jgi:hypothetical protein
VIVEEEETEEAGGAVHGRAEQQRRAHYRPVLRRILVLAVDGVNCRVSVIDLFLDIISTYLPAVNQLRGRTIVVADIGGDKNWCPCEKLPYGGPVMNVREQSRHRYLSSHQLEACDPGSEARQTRQPGRPIWQTCISVSLKWFTENGEIVEENPSDCQQNIQ